MHKEANCGKRWTRAAVIAGSVGFVCGCAMVPPRSFLDPTKVGMFPTDYQENEIRRVLTPRETPEGIANAVEPTPADLVASYDEYRIARLDRLAISIEDFMQGGVGFGAELQVDVNGYIRLPQLGTINVVGYTEIELERELTNRIIEAGILPKPIVQVLLTTRANGIYTVTGNVRTPGAYPLARPDLRLLDVIGLAGDIGPDARKLYVIRQAGAGAAATEPEAEDSGLVIPPPEDGDFGPNFFTRMGAGGAAQNPPPTTQDSAALKEMQEALDPASESAATQESPGEAPPDGARPFRPLVIEPGSGRAVESAPPETEPPGMEDTDFDWEDVPEYELTQRVIEINIDALRSGDPRQNIVIRDRDTIHIPQDTGVFYLMGEVNRPGVFGFGGREITVKQAIATAGNLSQLAWPSRCEIVRREKGTDKQITIPINLDRIFAGLEADVLLRDGDILNVGTDILAPFLFVVRNSFRFTYGFGFVYDRNFADQDAIGGRQNPEVREDIRRAQRGLPF